MSDFVLGFVEFRCVEEKLNTHASASNLVLRHNSSFNLSQLQFDGDVFARVGVTGVSLGGLGDLTDLIGAPTLTVQDQSLFDGVGPAIAFDIRLPSPGGTSSSATDLLLSAFSALKDLGEDLGRSP